MLLREFISGMFSEWGTGVTGGLSAPLVLWGLSTSGVPRAALIALAILCVYVSAYKMWKREHDARCAAEAELYSDAGMRGTTTVEIGAFNPLRDQTVKACFFTVSIDSHNSGQKACTIGQVRICVTPPIGVFVPYFEIPLDVDPTTVRNGEFFRFHSFPAIIQPGLSHNELRDSKISVALKDGSGRLHTFLETRISPRISEEAPQ